MKILDNIISIFNTKQRELIDNLMDSAVYNKTIKWREVFNKKLDERLARIDNVLTLERVNKRSKIEKRKIIEQLEDIILTFTALGYEYDTLRSTVNLHEMLKKDKVKTTYNIARDQISVLYNNVQNYYGRNISIIDGVVELQPEIVIEHRIRGASATYFPENIIQRIGNEPTAENLTSGTDADYWLTEILTREKNETGAYVELDYFGTIDFNTLTLNAAGKYPIKLTNIYIYQNDVWAEIDFAGKNTGKVITVVMVNENGNSKKFQASKIKLRIVQETEIFLWEKTITNELQILDNTDTEHNKSIINLLYNDTYDMYTNQHLTNVYNYMFGLYYVRTTLKTYTSDNKGYFYSRQYPITNQYQYVEVKATTYSPEHTNIEYNILQHNGERADFGTIENNTKMQITDKFDITENLNGDNTNKLVLQHYPIIDKTLYPITCIINDRTAIMMKQFIDNNQLQFIVNGDYLYFNKILLTTDNIEIQYSHRSDYFVVECILSSSSAFYTVDTPKIKSLELEFS
jgi:hypothetical protein